MRMCSHVRETWTKCVKTNVWEVGPVCACITHVWEVSPVHAHVPACDKWTMCAWACTCVSQLRFAVSAPWNQHPQGFTLQHESHAGHHPFYCGLAILPDVFSSLSQLILLSSGSFSHGTRGFVIFSPDEKACVLLFFSKENLADIMLLGLTLSPL